MQLVLMAHCSEQGLHLALPPFRGGWGVTFSHAYLHRSRSKDLKPGPASTSPKAAPRQCSLCSQPRASHTPALSHACSQEHRHGDAMGCASLHDAGTFCRRKSLPFPVWALQLSGACQFRQQGKAPSTSLGPRPRAQLRSGIRITQCRLLKRSLHKTEARFSKPLMARTARSAAQHARFWVPMQMGPLQLRKPSRNI